MTTHQSEGALLGDSPFKAMSATEKDGRNGSLELNGHTPPRETLSVSKTETIANHTTEKSVTQEVTETTILTQNEESFSANQALAKVEEVHEHNLLFDELNDDEPVKESTPAAMEGKASSDVDMVDAPARSEETPVDPISPAKESPAVEADGKPAAEAEPRSSTPSAAQAAPADESQLSLDPAPEVPEDVEMGDAETQPKPSPQDQTESTQETAFSQPNTPGPDVEVPAAISSGMAPDTTQASPAPPTTADTSMSDAPPSNKVSRERDQDSEDEPVAKRAKVDAVADQVEVKISPKESERPKADNPDSTPATAHSPYHSNGEARMLSDPSLDDNPISEWQSRQLRQILAGVKKTKAGAMFKNSVEVLWPTVWADYSARIQNPTDITTMERHLRGDLEKYKTLGAFKRDVNLLYENSVIFNGEGHDVTRAAKATRDTIFGRMSQHSAAEPAKVPKNPTTKHPSRHTEPRSTAQHSPTAAPPQRPPKTTGDAPSSIPPKPVVESPAFAIPANSNGVPLIRRDSTKPDSRTKRPVKPAHPKDLVYDTKRKKMIPELRFCEEVLQEIGRSKYIDFNAPFKLPVDPVALNIPHYHKIIKKPMDLKTMEKKMSAGEYSSAKEFERDFDLIVKNCKTFNGEDHTVYEQALKLQSIFRKEMAKKDEWLSKNAPASLPTPTHATTSPRLKDDSDEDDDADSEPDQIDESDKEYQASLQRQATIQRRLEVEQKNINDLLSSASPSMDDIEIAQSVVAMLQKNLLAERQKQASLPVKKASKPKPAKAKRPGGGASGGGSTKKSSLSGPSDNHRGGATKKSGGTKKQPTKRKIGVVEKEVIAAGIGELDGVLLERAIDIIKKDTGQGENDSGELELDIEVLSQEALVMLYEMAIKEFPGLRKEKESTLAAAPPPPPPAVRNKTGATKSKKNKPMSKIEQERRIQQLNELRAQAGRQGSGSQEPVPSIEGPGGDSMDPAPQQGGDSDEDSQSSEEE
ncbi:hypothetical protein B0H63DRAFT_391911 [Podospora didyma]|uniref:Bromodomain-containing factor 1 n=1 Tax=Podospora didyma TaxID=330526 RepID=A0AAE0NRL6_9PEZI|nr:hypothetical protein B0H63DRAFT_391911 [Podospora didyma]